MSRKNILPVSLILLAAYLDSISISKIFGEEIVSALKTPEGGGGWIYEYQTFFAGVIAFIGAMTTMIILIKQHSFEKRKHREEKQKKQFYMRSLMSDALSDLLSYSIECFKYVRDKKQRTPPKKPCKSIDILNKNILCSDLSTSNDLFKIVSFYQVHNDRLAFYKDSSGVYSKENMLYDIALLSCWFDCLFPYARNELETAELIFPTKKTMKSSVRQLFGEDYYSNLESFDSILSQIEKIRQIKEKFQKEDTRGIA